VPATAFPPGAAQAGAVSGASDVRGSAPLADFLFTDRPKPPATTGLDGNFDLDPNQARGWLHPDLQVLQQLQYLFLFRCWNAILIELSAVDRHAMARDLRQTINHPTECPASVFALAIGGK
jgi:hypothetical protein